MIYKKKTNNVQFLSLHDAAKIVESLEKIFVREGLIVITAPDAHVALYVLSNKNIDVLLTDLTMTSDMSGIDLLTKVKKDTRHIRSHSNDSVWNYGNCCTCHEKGSL